jgi:hypothetical protein
MGKRGKLIWVTATVALIVTAVLARGPLGRTRPDLAAWLSFDDGPLTFSRAYTSGRVGPFTIGDTHAAVVERLSSQHVLAQDVPQLSKNRSEWTVSLPASAGAYVTYTIAFTADRAVSIRTFYSVFSGL